MFKPETLDLLRRNIRTLSDDSMAHFFAVVLEEMVRRGSALKHYDKHPAISEGKDCDPIRGY